jgi:hypothetical protein
LPLARIGMEGPSSVSPPTPDVVVSFDWDDTASNAASAGAPGSEHSSPHGHRGMHGAFSPIDVRNVLVASGPSFRKGFVDDYPSSNLDLAPTIATLLGLSMPQAEGRVLDEALVTKAVEYKVESFEEQIGPVPIERMCKLDDPDCKKPVRGLEYGWTLAGQTLSTPDGGRRWVYLDRAKVARVPAKPVQ